MTEEQIIQSMKRWRLAISLIYRKIVSVVICGEEENQETLTLYRHYMINPKEFITNYKYEFNKYFNECCPKSYTKKKRSEAKQEMLNILNIINE